MLGKTCQGLQPPHTSLTGSQRHTSPLTTHHVKVKDQPPWKKEEDIKLYQKIWIDPLERMDSSRLPKPAFQYQPRGRRDVGRPRKNRKIKNTLRFKPRS
jgi:hypothetical protein